MNKLSYEQYMALAEECHEKAVNAHKRGDCNMKAFFYNAYQGYKMKARDLDFTEVE